MGIPDLTGRLFKALERSSAEQPIAKGGVIRHEAHAFVDWLKTFVGEKAPDGPNFPEEIFYRTSAKQLPANVPLTGTTGAGAIPSSSFLYLDVGAWIGSLGRRWSEYGNYKRDFGVICGRHVLVCTFSSTFGVSLTKGETTPTWKEDAGWTNAVKATNDATIDSIKALLARLDAASPDKLGKHVVTRYLAALPSQLVPHDGALHVIVGDMHIPVLGRDTEEQKKSPNRATYGGMPPIDYGIAEVWNRYVDSKKKSDSDPNDLKSGLVLLARSELGIDIDENDLQVIPAEIQNDPDFAYVQSLLEEMIERKIADETVVDNPVIGRDPIIGVNGDFESYGPRSYLLGLNDADIGELTANVLRLFRMLENSLIDDRPLPIRAGPRVARMGRLDLGPLERLIDSVMALSDTEEAQARKLIERLTPIFSGVQKTIDAIKSGTGDLIKSQVTLFLKDLLDGIGDWREKQDVWGVHSGTMLQADADRWYQFMHESMDPNALMPQADIFEDAGDDFVQFAAALNHYESKDRSADSKLRPLQFHQLGDMVDLWMGFSCHYHPAGRVDPDFQFATADERNTEPVRAEREARDPADVPSGADHARFWVRHCFSQADQGSKVAGAVESLVSTASRGHAPDFLYGNHDNYLGDPTIGGIQYATGVVPQRAPNYAKQGLFMEHGHQREGTNADNAPLLPFTRLLIGTNSPAGQLTTQAAFVRPRPSRDIDDVAQAAMDKATHPNRVVTDPGGYPGRLRQIAYAADSAVRDGADQPRFYCYVMGHTHTSCLTRVRVQPGDLEDRAELVLGKVADGSAHISLEVVQQVRPDAPFGILRLRYDGIAAEPGVDWIAIEDPASPAGHRRRALWEYVSPSPHETNYVVPPGRYVARYDPGVDLDAASIPTTAPVAIWGVSIEVPPSDDETNPDLVKDKQGSLRRYEDTGSPLFQARASDVDAIHFRWAIEDADAMGDRYVVRLFAMKDFVGQEPVALHRKKGPPSKKLKDLVTGSKTFGRWKLDADFVSYAAQRVPRGSAAAFVMLLLFQSVTGNDETWVLAGQAWFTLARHE